MLPCCSSPVLPGTDQTTALALTRNWCATESYHLHDVQESTFAGVILSQIFVISWNWLALGPVHAGNALLSIGVAASWQPLGERTVTRF